MSGVSFNLMLYLYVNTNMYMKKEKELIKTLTIRLSNEQLDEYRKFCENNDYSISKRLRRLMKLDIEGNMA